MSRTQKAVLIIAIVTTVAAVVFFVFGVHQPTIASNTAIGTWVIFVALTVGRRVSLALDALCAHMAHDQAKVELLNTGRLRRSDLHRVD